MRLEREGEGEGEGEGRGGIFGIICGRNEVEM